jgi:methylmalonyl-CoA/ethylmalonyl-CoA epimerase
MNNTDGQTMRFHHVGLVCRDLAEGRAGLEAMLGLLAWSQSYEDPIQQVCAQFATDAAGMRYELIAPTNEKSPVQAPLKQGKNILNHLAYTVPCLEEQAASLRQQGCLPTGEPQPGIAFASARIQFFVSPMRWLVELIEQPPKV